MAARTAQRTYAPAKIQLELPNQPCALAWVGDALVAATYDYVEAEGVARRRPMPATTARAEPSRRRSSRARRVRAARLAVGGGDETLGYRLARLDLARPPEPKGHPSRRRLGRA